MSRKQQPWSSFWTRIGKLTVIPCVVLPLALASLRDARAVPPDSPADKQGSATRSAAAGPSNDRKATKPAARQVRRRTVGRIFTLGNQAQVDALLSEFPELSGVTDLRLQDVKVPIVPDALLKEISLRGKDIDTLTIGVGSTSTANGETAPEVSDQGMAYISRLKNLTRLCIDCRCSAKGLTHLTKLPELKTLGLDHLALTSREVFPIVARMPKIEFLGFRWCDFSQPVDAATHKAIASLNGRLKSLDFGEYAETMIHRSMFPAIAEIKSLTYLELGNFVATYEDLDPIRKNLLNLEHFGPAGKTTEGIRRVNPLRKQ